MAKPKYKSLKQVQDELALAKEMLGKFQANINDYNSEIARHPDNPKLKFYKHLIQKWGYTLGVNAESNEGFMYFPDGRIEQAPGMYWNTFVSNYRHVLKEVPRPDVEGFIFPLAS